MQRLCLKHCLKILNCLVSGILDLIEAWGDVQMGGGCPETLEGAASLNISNKWPQACHRAEIPVQGTSDGNTKRMDSSTVSMAIERGPTFQGGTVLPDIYQNTGIRVYDIFDCTTRSCYQANSVDQGAAGILRKTALGILDWESIYQQVLFTTHAHHRLGICIIATLLSIRTSTSHSLSTPNSF